MNPVLSLVKIRFYIALVVVAVGASLVTYLVVKPSGTNLASKVTTTADEDADAPEAETDEGDGEFVDGEDDFGEFKPDDPTPWPIFCELGDQCSSEVNEVAAEKAQLKVREETIKTLINNGARPMILSWRNPERQRRIIDAASAEMGKRMQEKYDQQIRSEEWQNMTSAERESQIAQAAFEGAASVIKTELLSDAKTSGLISWGSLPKPLAKLFDEKFHKVFLDGRHFNDETQEVKKSSSLSFNIVPRPQILQGVGLQEGLALQIKGVSGTVKGVIQIHQKETRRQKHVVFQGRVSLTKVGSGNIDIEGRIGPKNSSVYAVWRTR